MALFPLLPAGTPIPELYNSKGRSIIFYRGGGYLFRKKIVRKLWLAENICLLQDYEGKNCLQSKENFLQIHWYFKILTQIGPDMKVSFSFI